MNYYNILSSVLHTKSQNDSFIPEIVGYSKADYIYIKLSDNNDSLICKYLPNNVKVITEINSILDYATSLNFHVKELGRYPDYIMFPTSSMSTEDGMDTVYSLVTSPFAPKFGLVDPEVDDIKYYHDTYGIWPDLVSLRICPPVGFPRDVIDYCKALNIQIIATNVTDSEGLFSASYLYRLAASCADMVCAECNTIEDSLIWPSLLNNLKQSSIDFNTEEVINIKTNIQYNPAMKPIKDINNINLYTEVNGDIFKVENLVNNSLDNTVMSIEDIQDISTEEKLSEVETTVLNSLSEPLPIDMTDIGEIRYILRRQAEELLNDYYKDKVILSNIETVFIGSNLMIITVTTKYLKVFKSHASFILCVNEGDNGPVVYFKEIPQKEVEKL